jgi:hypothetical protein
MKEVRVISAQDPVKAYTAQAVIAGTQPLF